MPPAPRPSASGPGRVVTERRARLLSHSWNPSDEYRKIVEANRRYYARTARIYNATETCMVQREAQVMLEEDLDQIISLLGGTRPSLRALDACGGTGNVALKLLRRGLVVTISDVSESQLDIFREECDKTTYSADAFRAEIGEFLAERRASYDLIVFSSALHHIVDIPAVLRQAYVNLRPGGFVYTVFDPTPRRHQRPVTRRIVWLDYVAFKLLSQTRDLPAALRRRLGRWLNKRSSSKTDTPLGEEAMGWLAEYHVDQGIDDLALVQDLQEMGYRVIWHRRYPHARYALVRWLLGRLGEETDFKLLLQKPIAGSPPGDRASGPGHSVQP